MTSNEEERAICDALDVLLGSIIADRAMKPLRPGPSRSFTREDLDRLVGSSPAQAAALALLDNPREGAFTMALKALGERLHEIGGMRAMQQALDDVTERDPENEGRRTAILDQRWSGIGSWMA